MNKARLLWSKRSLVTVLSLGFMVLGIGCISGVVLRLIWAPSTSSRYSIPTTFKVEITAPVKSDKIIYPVYPAEGDNIGSLTIPALNQQLPILQGTGVTELEKGVGHFAQSVLPGEEDNCVISGHRDTVFSEIGNLKIGDSLIVQTSAGTFTYEVTGTRIVHKDDKTVIVPTDHAVLTLTTCYPFDYIGHAPDRYIISADLVKK
jgi:sortase A